jgi:hypothetical protein
LWLDHPRQQIWGASFNYDFGSWVLRGGATTTEDSTQVDFTPTAGLKGYDFYDEAKYLLGVDTSFFSTHGFPGAGGSPLSASFEVYYRKTGSGYEFSPAKPFNLDDNWRFTYAFNTFFLHGNLLVVYAGIYDQEETLLQVLTFDYTWDGRLYFKTSIAATFGDTAAVNEFAVLIPSSEIGFRLGYRF